VNGYKKLLGGAVIGEALLLALEHAPEHALPLIRKGLISDIPCNRTTTAATQALIAASQTVIRRLAS
jgi:hypothetical protein